MINNKTLQSYIMEKISKLFVELPKDYELEARLYGQFINKFSINRFVSAYSSLFSLYTYKEMIKYAKDNKGVRYRYRLFSDGNYEFICKTRVVREKFEDQWFNIVVSAEKPIDFSRFEEIFGNVFDDETSIKARYKAVINNCLVELSDIAEVEKLESTTPEQLYDTVLWLVTSLQDSPKLVTRSDYEVVNQVLKKVVIQRPITLNKSRLNRTKDALYISPKYDGLRVFLIIKGDKVLQADLKKSIKYINHQRIYTDKFSVLDCELVNGVHYLMEVLVYNEQDLSNESFDVRISYRNQFDFPQKPYYPFTRLSDIYKYSIGEYVDGSIIVTNKEILKWKPQVTVDILLKKKDIQYRGWHVHNRDQVPNDTICEFLVEIGNKTLYFLKIRDDKPSPNSIKVFDDNVSGIVTKNILVGEGLKLMKAYHIRERNKMVKIKSAKNLLSFGPVKFKKESIKHYKKVLYVDSESKSIGKFTPDVIATFYSINKLDINYLVTLLKNMDKGGKFIGVIMAYIEDVDNDLYKVKKLEDNKYLITLYGTKIVNSKETLYDLHEFDQQLRKLGFVVDYMSKLDQGNMSSDELILSSWYVKFSYTKT